MKPSTRRRMIPLVVIAMIALSPLLVLAIYVEDWSRDLTTNTAATSTDHPDERLHPIDTDQSSEQVLQAASQFAASRPAWKLAEEKPLPGDSPLLTAIDGASFESVHLVRTTGLMRYRDDVWLVIENRKEQSRLHAESRSRVGKGDLGQNPRNLRELLGELREQL